MKCFLLIAPLTIGLFSPISAKAENYKLLVKVLELDSVSTSVLTMASKEACNKGKNRVLQKSQWDGNDFRSRSSIAAICIKSE